MMRFTLLALAVALVACGSPKTPAPDTTSVRPDPTPITEIRCHAPYTTILFNQKGVDSLGYKGVCVRGVLDSTGDINVIRRDRLQELNILQDTPALPLSTWLEVRLLGSQQ